ncbi:MAG TPA: CooT family nickel-binding protein [Methanothrix sp.]|jgi:predicted RNA-binding protein|uniref:CooT family nickel-binding protein n=1 Tax=Methanothrix sp. TaxID=90426 RepID=UPI002CF482D9|nr:CooT family nickel-binding protein [Methanothrix sp.]MDI9418394.1 CooT family nickel-binding protein [Euryarchaeota archaeon]HON35049.1 CooT family nickel-binding protein [Methanothrix sp.]HRU75495.1 CooT family nickel-binding protein [Methanothrix sp.]
MCELTVYTLRDGVRDKVMAGVVRLMVHDGKVILESIFGDSMEVEGKISEVNIMSQSATIIG